MVQSESGNTLSSRGVHSEAHCWARDEQEERRGTHSKRVIEIGCTGSTHTVLLACISDMMQRCTVVRFPLCSWQTHTVLHSE